LQLGHDVQAAGNDLRVEVYALAVVQVEVDVPAMLGRQVDRGAADRIGGAGAADLPQGLLRHLRHAAPFGCGNGRARILEHVGALHVVVADVDLVEQASGAVGHHALDPAALGAVRGHAGDLA